MKYLVVTLVAGMVMASTVMAAKKEAAEGEAAPKKVEKAAAVPSFKGKLAVTKDEANIIAATLTVKDVAYQIKLDDNGMKLAGEAAGKDVSVKGAVASIPGADGKEIKTITVESFKVVEPKAPRADGVKKEKKADAAH
jgi:flagellar basal body-associated protein FliL